MTAFARPRPLSHSHPYGMRGCENAGSRRESEREGSANACESPDKAESARESRAKKVFAFERENACNVRIASLNSRIKKIKESRRPARHGGRPMSCVDLSGASRCECCHRSWMVMLKITPATSLGDICLATFCDPGTHHRRVADRHVTLCPNCCQSLTAYGTCPHNPEAGDRLLLALV